MRGHESHAEARHGDQTPEHGRHADQGAQARARYLRLAGGGLVAAYVGSVTKPAELRTGDGNPWLFFFGTVARLSDEAAARIRVEYLGDDAEALAPRLVSGAQIYAEGRLSLSTWAGSDGAERTGLNLKATYLEVLGARS